MEEVIAGVDIWGIAFTIFAASGLASLIASFTTNARGKNRAVDFVLDVIELIAFNINKATNAKE